MQRVQDITQAWPGRDSPGACHVPWIVNDGSDKLKMRQVIPIVLLLAGCGRTLQTSNLSVEQATGLAVKLANERAQALYHCQPFRDGPSAEFVQGRWVWSDLKAQGQLDVEGSVSFGADGANLSVSVIILDNRPTLPIR